MQYGPNTFVLHRIQFMKCPTYILFFGDMTVKYSLQIEDQLKEKSVLCKLSKGPITKFNLYYSTDIRC